MGKNSGTVVEVDLPHPGFQVIFEISTDMESFVLLSNKTSYNDTPIIIDLISLGGKEQAICSILVFPLDCG